MSLFVKMSTTKSNFFYLFFFSFFLKGYSDALDPEKTLEQNGISGDDEVRIVYDYRAIDYPLLK